MKKISVVLASVIFALCTSVFASPVGEEVSYEMNRDRTSWLIRSGNLKLSVVEHRAESEYGPGYIVRIDYMLNVFMRGKQEGNVGLFVPEVVFGSNFYSDLEENPTMSFGSFDIEYLGQGDAEDADGMSYECTKARVYNIEPSYTPGTTDGSESKVLWIEHSGSIEFVNDLELKLRVNPNVPVLGAVQIDVSGVSNNGIGFEAGLDAKM